MTTYYDLNAQSFFDATVDVSMDKLYEQFIPHVPIAGFILDLGCGSGRDSKYFLDKGFKVEAIEPSAKLAKLASEYLQQKVVEKTAQEINKTNTYDAVWACASLLHIPYIELEVVFNKIEQSLKSGGFLYCSFKNGQGETERNGRIFTDIDQTLFEQLIPHESKFKIFKTWISTDLRVGREDENWFNALLKKS